MKLWMNVYQAGYWHRQGKPGHTNLHGGDLFVSQELAERYAEPDKGLVCTCEIEIDLMPGISVISNPLDSEPTPLHITRGRKDMLAPWGEYHETR